MTPILAIWVLKTWFYGDDLRSGLKFASLRTQASGITSAGVEQLQGMVVCFWTYNAILIILNIVICEYADCDNEERPIDELNRLHEGQWYNFWEKNTTEKWPTLERRVGFIGVE